jgi:hypothetical protein
MTMNDEQLDEYVEARAERDRLRGVALYGPRNRCCPGGDQFARWSMADPDDLTAFRGAVEACAASYLRIASAPAMGRVSNQHDPHREDCRFSDSVPPATK